MEVYRNKIIYVHVPHLCTKIMIILIYILSYEVYFTFDSLHSIKDVHAMSHP